MDNRRGYGRDDGRILVQAASCKGRRMSDMEPDGDTVEVVVGNPDTSSVTDTIPGQS